VRVGEEVAELLSRGVAAIAATRSAELRPDLVRGWGIRVSEERDAIDLCLEVPDGSPVRENLADNGSLALTASLPTTYKSVQVKGVATEVREPSDDELAAVEEHVAAFGREAAQVGLPPDGAQRLMGSGFVAVTLEVREVYDQTPGPAAGAPL
jgi:hypothetical protein